MLGSFFHVLLNTVLPHILFGATTSGVPNPWLEDPRALLGIPLYLNKSLLNVNNRSIVFDAHVSYKVKSFKFAFIIDNLLSTTYSVRPLGVSAPRLTTIQITYKI